MDSYKKCSDFLQNFYILLPPTLYSFNSLLINIRNKSGCTTESFKAALDKHLKSIPDEPRVPKLIKYCSKSSNSLIQNWNNYVPLTVILCCFAFSLFFPPAVPEVTIGEDNRWGMRRKAWQWGDRAGDLRLGRAEEDSWKPSQVSQV